MTIKLNKTIKTQIVEAAVKAKFKPLYEKALRDLSVAARKFAIENSLHEEAIKCSPELLSYINKQCHIDFQNSIDFNLTSVATLLTGRSRTWIYDVRFDDPVYAVTVNRLPDNTPELASLRSVVTNADQLYSEMSQTVHSYTKAEKMFEDLPWTKEFYPEKIVTGTSVVAKETIGKLNQLMSDL